MNISQRVYFYAYLNMPYQNRITDNFVKIQNASIKAYNFTNNSAVVNISKNINIATIYNGFGSFMLEPKDYLVYFLEVPLPDGMITYEYQPFKDDENTTMDGNHYTNGAVRIPLKVEGIQTRKKKYL